jgi:hypothetical protein
MYHFNMHITHLIFAKLPTINVEYPSLLSIRFNYVLHHASINDYVITIIYDYYYYYGDDDHDCNNLDIHPSLYVQLDTDTYKIKIMDSFYT